MTIDRRTWDPRSDLAEEAAKDVHGLIRRQCLECGGSYIAHCIPCAEAALARLAIIRKLEVEERSYKTRKPKASSKTAEERQARELAELYGAPDG